MMRITPNMTGMNTARTLREGQRSLEESLARIASGQRLNKAADDASGMMIADSLDSQAGGMDQAIQNANQAMAMAQIADGALSESSQLVQTIREKSLQAANDSHSPQSRQAIQADINRLLEQMGNIAETTTYNGQALLSGNFSDKSFQVGAESGQTVSLSIQSAVPQQLGDPEAGMLTDIDVTTPEGAQTAIGIADAALADLNANRSAIGSMQNQLVSSINNLTNSRQNIFAAESTIRDTDLAEESITLARLKLLNRARTYAQVKANQHDADTRILLKGDA